MSVNTNYDIIVEFDPGLSERIHCLHHCQINKTGMIPSIIDRDIALNDDSIEVVAADFWK